MTSLVLTVLALVPLSNPAEVKTELEGTWAVKSLLFRGAESKDARDRKAEWVFKGDKTMVRFEGKDDSEGWQTFRLDSTKDPKEIDLQGPGGTAKGIYRVEGDTLTICLPLPFVTKERPTKFESDRTGKFCLLTRTRKK